MRLLELQLKAFGPFTGRSLDLSGGEPGLHVVFGPNEAGKSSALRALKVLLFGFPQRSSDDFLHPYEQLRVGGRLLLADGSEVAFVRRKGLKHTLLSAEDESPLDDGFLDRCLHGMEERHFSNLFGIDHKALVDGGRELLEQHGEVGQALFAAGLGSRSLRRVLDSLDEEADALFLSRGSKPLINQAVAEHKAAKRELAEASLSGREFEGDRKELERRREQAEALRLGIAERERERNRLQRLRRALPLLAERRRLAVRSVELAGVSVLSPDFPDRRREVQEALRKTREDGHRAAVDVAVLTEEASGLTIAGIPGIPGIAGLVLAQAETIERLHQHVGRFTKDLADRQRLEGESRELHAQAAELLEEVRPGWTLEEAEALRPAIDRWMRIQELGNQRQALAGALDQARRITREAEGAIAEAVESEQLRLGILRLGLWSGTADELEALPVPPAETLERFSRDFAVLADRLRALEERRQAAQGGAGEAARQLEVLRRAGAVPTEDDLAEARQRREEGWLLIKRQEAGKNDLFDAYEHAVRQADEIADRLRREADRVQLQARLSADRDQRAAEAEALDAQLAGLAEEAGRAEAAWRDLWRPCGIEPLPPREMHPGWTSRHERLRDRAEAVREARRRAEARLAAARRDEEAALDALAAWSGAWSEAIRGLGLGGDALPSEVNQLAESLRRISEARRDAEKIDRRLGGLDRDLEIFRADVRALAAELAPDRPGPSAQPPDQTAVHLHALLQDARRQADRRKDLEAGIAKHDRQARDAEATRQAMEERLVELRREANCEDDAGLEEAERKSAEVRDLQRDLDRCERQLLEAGEGAALDELEREAGSVDADELPGRIEQLDREVEELERQLGDLREELGRSSRELEHRTGGDAAAQAAERAAEALARVRDGVDRYVRLRLAGILLRRRIERYRVENQAPLLRRAGELFATLTLGSFSGLQTDFDERDEPVLAGVRAKGRPVRVEGMSDGTRDQLYLALRLATLEKYLAHGEPLPFVVDDILINFDDRRSEATLKALAELSKCTQVILFTHHERLRDMAGALRNGAGVFVRELG